MMVCLPLNNTQLMPDYFKIVLAKLFGILRVKASAYPGLLEPDTSELIANEAANVGTGGLAQV